MAAKNPSDEALHCELLLALGNARAKAAVTEQARAAFRQAAVLARNLHDAARMAAAALGLSTTGAQSWLVEPERVALLEEALTMLG
ncbi:MAG: hypothetical protein ACR2PL_25750 [Dehalococcoidia bacterium]